MVGPVLCPLLAASRNSRACGIQGDRAPWINTQNYKADKKLLKDRNVDDGVLQFSSPAEPAVESEFIESDAA